MAGRIDRPFCEHCCLVDAHLVTVFVQNRFANAFHFQQLIDRGELTVRFALRNNGVGLSTADSTELLL